MIPNYVWAFIKSWEGGDTITDHPDDTGGVTKYGLSQNNNRDVDVRNLTEMDAQELYLERYWNTSNCNDLPEYMRLVQFNCAVNCGPNTARKTLQKAVGAKPDGKIGPKTRQRIKRFGNKPRVFLVKYLSIQALYYFNIVQRRESQHIWLKGWMRRTFDAMYVTAVNYGKRSV